MRIFKYPLEIVDDQSIEMPFGAEILTVQMQNDKCCLWAKVNETQKHMVARKVSIYGTGHPMPDNPGKYICTFQVADGVLVFHAFDSTLPDNGPSVSDLYMGR